MPIMGDCILSTSKQLKDKPFLTEEETKLLVQIELPEHYGWWDIIAMMFRKIIRSEQTPSVEIPLDVLMHITVKSYQTVCERRGQDMEEPSKQRPTFH